MYVGAVDLVNSEFWTRNLAMDSIKGCYLFREDDGIRDISYHFSFLLLLFCCAFLHIFSYLSCNTEFPITFIFWNIFSNFVEYFSTSMLFHLFIFFSSLKSLFNFICELLGGFTLVWHLFVVGSCKARRKTYHFGVLVHSDLLIFLFLKPSKMLY